MWLKNNITSLKIEKEEEAPDDVRSPDTADVIMGTVPGVWMLVFVSRCHQHTSKDKTTHRLCAAKDEQEVR